MVICARYATPIVNAIFDPNRLNLFSKTSMRIIGRLSIILNCRTRNIGVPRIPNGFCDHFRFALSLILLISCGLGNACKQRQIPIQVKTPSKTIGTLVREAYPTDWMYALAEKKIVKAKLVLRMNGAADMMNIPVYDFGDW